MDRSINVDNVVWYAHANRQSNYSFIGHTHDSWEINIVTKGEFHVTYDDHVIPLKENMLMLFKGDVFHHNRVVSSKEVELFVYQFYTRDIPSLDDARVYQLDDNNLALVRLIADESERDIFPSHQGYLRINEFTPETAKLMEVLLARLLAKEHLTTRQETKDEMLYQEAIRFMKKNLKKSICTEDVAKHCMVSTAKIKKVFTKLAGRGIMNLYSDMKITTAKAMLLENISISDISEQLGFSSPAYMSACFKKHTGLSPLAYKKSARSN